MSESALWNAVLIVPPLLVAVILHEIAHGWTAERFGDPTARELGRISLNPLVHIDPFLTLMLPGMLILMGSSIIFGGAKPVPVNLLRLRNPRRAMLWVAAAGPATNFVLALISYLLLLCLPLSVIESGPAGALGASWLAFSVLINVVLGVFNLLPVPPLDGGRIAVSLLPDSAARRLAGLEPFGILIVFAFIYFGLFELVLGPVLRLVSTVM